MLGLSAQIHRLEPMWNLTCVPNTKVQWGRQIKRNSNHEDSKSAGRSRCLRLYAKPPNIQHPTAKTEWGSWDPKSEGLLSNQSKIQNPPQIQNPNGEAWIQTVMFYYQTKPKSKIQNPRSKIQDGEVWIQKVKIYDQTNPRSKLHPKSRIQTPSQIHNPNAPLQPVRILDCL